MAVILTIVALFFILLINQSADRMDARAAISVINGTYNVSTSGSLTLAVFLIWAIAMFVLLAKHKGWLLILIGVGLFASSCSGGATYATTNPRDVVFVVDLADPTDQTQVTGEVIGDQKDPEFWEEKKQPVNIQRIPIPTTYKRTGAGILGTDLGANFSPFPALMVVTVPVTSESLDWVAPAITCDAPKPDMSNAFSMQSLEANGGSVGVYTGASISAFISNPSQYLSIYGYGDENADNHTHPAKSLQEILSKQIRSFIQQELSREYGSRSIVRQNQDMTTIFSNIFSHLNTTFEPTGITITSFYDRDGNVYDNCKIQEGFDQELDRKNLYDQANATATLLAINSNAQIEGAYAQATMTAIAVNSSVEAQQKQADVVNNNPNALVQQWIDKWNGQVSQVQGGNTTSYVPVLITPAPQPTPGH